MKRQMVFEAVSHNTETHSISVRVADASDRQSIYRMRHAVYVEELHQHVANTAQALSDTLDDWNIYIVAHVGDELAGFISITPPEARSLSVEKYFERDALPVKRDGKLFEARLLTVQPRYRGTSVATLLMYAALRHVEANGGEPHHRYRQA